MAARFFVWYRYLQRLQKTTAGCNITTGRCSNKSGNFLRFIFFVAAQRDFTDQRNAE